MNLDKLKELGVANPEKVFAQICEIGGFGKIDPSHAGGIDLTGLNPQQKAAVDALLRPAKQEPAK